MHAQSTPCCRVTTIVGWRQRARFHLIDDCGTNRLVAKRYRILRVWQNRQELRCQQAKVPYVVQRLRAKLGVAGALIETVRGFGYRLRGEQARAP